MRLCATKKGGCSIVGNIYQPSPQSKNTHISMTKSEKQLNSIPEFQLITFKIIRTRQYSPLTTIALILITNVPFEGFNHSQLLLGSSLVGILTAQCNPKWNATMSTCSHPTHCCWINGGGAAVTQANPFGLVHVQVLPYNPSEIATTKCRSMG